MEQTTQVAEPTPQPAAEPVSESFDDVSQEVLAEAEKSGEPETPPAEPGDTTVKSPETPPAPTFDVSKLDPKVVEMLSKMDSKQIAESLSGGKVPREQVIELAKRIDAYEKTGLTPEKIMELRDRAMNPQSPEPKKDFRLSDDEDENRSLMEARNGMLKSFPELQKMLEGNADPKYEELSKSVKEINDYFKSWRESQEQAKKAQEEEAAQKWKDANAEGEKHLFGLLETAGIPGKNERVRNAIMGSMLEIINTNPDLADRFYKSRDMKVMDEVFKEFSDVVFSGVTRKTKAEILSEKTKQGSMPTKPIPGSPAQPEKPKFDDNEDFKDVNESLLNGA